MNHAVSTSFTYAQEVDRREAAGSAAMWLENCESREAGVYVPMNTEEKDGQITTSYLVYRKGLTAETGGIGRKAAIPLLPVSPLSYTDDNPGIRRIGL